MHTNDTHAHLEQVAKRVTAVNNVRQNQPDALLVDAGDVFSGTLYFTQYKGQADLGFMNLMKYDLMTFGNHEFDLGNSPEGHQALADFIEGADFPIVSSNVDLSADNKLKGFFNDEISAAAEGGNVYNGVIKEVNGEKVGFFGLTTAETADIGSPVNVTFENYIEEAKKAVASFEKAGVNKIVAITHIGYGDNTNVDTDQILAKSVEGIDVIVGGHDHIKLTEPDVVTTDLNGQEKDPTVIVQAYQYGDFLGTLDVDFDKEGRVIGQAGQLIKVADQVADAEAAAMLAEYDKTIDELKNKSTGAEAVVELENPRDGGDTSKPSVRKNETPLGNLITDSMLATAQQYDENTVIAMQNGGGIRAGIDQGDISYGDVLTVLPFGNTLAKITLTGTEIKEALEHSVSKYPSENGAFLHVSGMKYTFDSSKEAGKRIQSMQVEQKDGSFVAIESDKTYVVATNAFTAAGGDGFTVFKNAYTEGRVTDYGLTDWETFKDYLADLKTVNPQVEDRIKDVAEQTK